MTVGFAYEDDFEENELLFGLTEEDLMEFEAGEIDSELIDPDLYDQYEYMLDHQDNE